MEDLGITMAIYVIIIGDVVIMKIFIMADTTEISSDFVAFYFDFTSFELIRMN